MTFNVGDRVTWESQSAGKWKEKTGVVEVVVPAGIRPKRSGCGMQRDHESYIVRVWEGNRTRTYWPRVNLLMPWDGCFTVTP